MANNSTQPTDLTASDAGIYGAYLAIALMAVIPIYVGSYASLKFPKKKKSGKRYNDDDEPEFFSFDDAKWYPVVGSVTLFSLYLILKFVSKDIINLVLTLNFVVLGMGAVFKVLIGALRRITGLALEGDYAIVLTHKDKDVSGYNFGFTHLIVMIITAAIAGLYGYTKHWVLSNIYGESFSIAAIQLLNLDSFATGMLLLAGLFFYDIFWVFGTDVMVTVAKGLDIPIKVIFPKDFVGLALDGLWKIPPKGTGFSMLGLGDIVIPGIFVALCLNFDHYHYLQTSAGKKDKNSTKFPTPYFTTCLILYILGLATTIYVMHTFKAAQPALLYLSPACILSALGVAFFRGELKDLFAYTHQGSPAASKKSKDSSSNTESPSKPKRSRSKKEDIPAVGSEEADVSEPTSPQITRQRRSTKK